MACRQPVDRPELSTAPVRLSTHSFAGPTDDTRPATTRWLRPADRYSPVLTLPAFSGNPRVVRRPPNAGNLNAPWGFFRPSTSRTQADDQAQRRPFRTYAHDAAILETQARASRPADVLSHGRLLRAVLRRRQEGRRAARHYPDCARTVGGHGNPHGRDSFPFCRRLSGTTGQAGRIGGDLRADRRPGHQQGAGGTPGGAHHHPRYGERRSATR